ncbi:hypothetical protein [Mucilaginibacter sp. AK015]|uniref:hypothetical protein n=1 Tax=Mucilaginibacter sp. AK015 TaxID=2723072 RepID=UPI0016181D6C|nr:hypothetical protein [Mucilaginibacter sp. AK015]MBB5394453.1 4-amino-4-deoxy-L-arabinose transferase-like glycosyltransferase [Mucilaginibacter sp. AK015]
MWHFVKKYYLATFLGFLAATLLKELLNRSDRTFVHSFVVAVIVAFVISVVAGTIYYFQDTKWGPNKRKKLFTKPPFSHLLMNRFVQEDDAAVGVIDGYNVVVLYTWPNGGSAISISVFFDMDFANRYKGGIEEISKRNKVAAKEGFAWGNEGMISYLIDYSFKLPTYEKIMQRAEMMIAILKAEGLPADKLDDAEKPMPATGNVARFGFAG